MNRSSALQRIGPLADLPAVLEPYGVPVEEVFRGLDVGPDCLMPDNFLPLSTILPILQRSAELTGCPHIGLTIGARCDHACLGRIGRLMACAPTLREALRDFVGWQIGNSRAAAVYLQRTDSGVIIGYGICDRHTAGAAHLYDLGLAVACNFIRALSGGLARPEAVLISHRAPADIAPYRQVLQAPLLFGQDQTGIILTRSSMDARNPGAHPGERRRALEDLQAPAARYEASARVRHALRAEIQFGDASLPAVAAKLGVHPRTLERQLAGEGSGFEALRDEVRQIVACELLDLTDLPIGDISITLGFATHSAFAHAFRRWTGTSPSRYRASSVPPSTANQTAPVDLV